MVFILNKNLTNKYNFFQSLLLFSTRSLLIDLSFKLKVHRANCQTISSCPNRFFTDIVNNNNIPFLLFFVGFFYFSIFFSFFCFLIVCFFCLKQIYSDTHATVRRVSDKKLFIWPISGNKTTFIFGLVTPDLLLNQKCPGSAVNWVKLALVSTSLFTSTFH